MFSGIIEDLGTLVAARPRGRGRTLSIRTGLPLGPGPGPDQPGARVKLGDSIAVAGACLTVESMDPSPRQGGVFTVAAVHETLTRTILGQCKVGDRLHLERALRLGDRLDGHMVAGHVDAIGQIQRVQAQAESLVVWVMAPVSLAPFLAEKGSVCVDGVSLTVNEVNDAGSRGCAFRVNLIPFTTTHTVAVGYRPGDRVNLEADLVARYLDRLLRGHGTDGSEPEQGGRASLTRQRLVDLGFGPPPRGGGH